MNETPLLTETGRQLGEYFEGKRKCFELPLAPKGTPFQMRCSSVHMAQLVTFSSTSSPAGSLFCRIRVSISRTPE